MNDTPLYISKRMAKNLWQEYRIYHDRVELQSRFLFHTIIVPVNEIQAVEIRPSFFSFSGRKEFIWGMKMDNCDWCRHVLLTKTRGLFKRVGFAPDEPEKFVEICKSILPGS